MCNNMDETQKHYAEWKNSYTKVYIICFNIYDILKHKILIFDLKKKTQKSAYFWV